MNKFKKIGLSALAGSLVAVSANAVEMSVSGGASLTISDQGNATEGNTWTMGDGLTFTASGETDGGITVSTSYTLDGAGGIDAFSMSMGTDSMGTVTFTGDDGSSALGAVDDVTPNAYEEAWHGAANSATSGAGTVINGYGGDNMFSYTSPTTAGLTATVSYLPSSAAGSAKSTTAWALAYSPEMVEGLTVGYATQEDESGAASTTGYNTKDTDENTFYVKYVYGPVTVGYQASESDVTSETTDDHDTEAFGITYAVSDELTIGYGQHTFETTGDSALVDQESTAITASYTMGGMTIAGIMNDVDNISGVATDDKEAYELTLSFAF
jgi:outer membrane protein OmpU